MASGAEQFAADFKQVKKTLSQYPDITIIRTEGEPPDHYEIEYHLKGYKKNTDGAITPDDHHSVLIKLPFGYPHFPPTVKPLTPIFHPDIDPDAIRIADYWQDNKSLPDLILHIGKMICGTFYCPNDPFNPEAFDWYEKRRDWLPFDSLEIDEVEKTAASLTTSKENIPPPLGALNSSTRSFEEKNAQTEDKEPLKSPQDDIQVPLPFEGEPIKASTDETQDLASDIPLDFLDDDIQAPLPSEGEPIKAPDEEKGLDADLTSVTLDDDTFDALGLDDDIPVAVESEDQAEYNLIAENHKDRDSQMPVGTFEDEAPPDLKTSDHPTDDRTEAHKQETSSTPIQAYLDQNKFFKAKKFLADIPKSTTVPERAELEKSIDKAIGKAEELYKKAETLEQGGELEKAGLILDQIANIVIDYPGLDIARNRIRDALMAKISDQDRKQKTAVATTAPGKKPPLADLAHLPYKQLIIVLVFLGLCGAGAFLYLRDKSNLEKADINVHNALKFKAQKQYNDAKKAADTAQSLLNKIFILKGAQKKALEEHINTLVHSEDFKQGLLGRILYNGEYISLKAGKKLIKFNRLANKAGQLSGSGKITEAILAYEKALAYAEQAGLKDRTEKIRRTLINLRLKQTLAWAKKAEEGKEWRQAAETYRRALELSSSLSSPEDKKDIAKRLAAAAFHNELDQSKTAFTSSEWQKTIEMLERAEKILAENPKAASVTEKRELHKLLVNSRLYLILATAKKAYDTGKWTIALNEYHKAIDLLEHHTDIIGDDVIQEGVNKIEKTILMTKVAREQGEASLAVKNDDLAATLTHYQAIIDLINNSRFHDDPVLKKIMEKSHNQFTATHREYEINRKIKWLKDNFENIFRENYPSAGLSLLEHPQVSFIKKVGDKVIFNLSCIERRQGRAFRLELNYQYDQTTKAWSLYSGE